MAIILGKVSDRIQNRRFFVAMSALTSIPCILLIFLAKNIDSYALANGLLEFASFVFPVLLFAILTDKLEKTKNDSVVSREFLLDIGRGSSIGVLMLLLYMGYTPQQCFLLAIPFLLLGALAHEYRNAPAAAS
jgi:predicted MFS family arabinose efflux permease